MTSNNIAQDEDESKQHGSKKSRADFITSPIDSGRQNALLDRELRLYLKYSENFNRLVKAGILLSNGRVVCSDEQWNETREILLKKIHISIYGRRASTSPETKYIRSAGPGRGGVSNIELGSASKGKVRTGRSNIHPLLENQEDSSSHTSEELWGSMSNMSRPGTSKEKSSNKKGSTHSRENSRRYTSQSLHRTGATKSTIGKTSSVASVKDERLPDIKRKLREQDALNKQRIFEQLRRDQEKRELPLDRQHETKDLQGKPKVNIEENEYGRNDSQASESSVRQMEDKADKAEEGVLRTLRKSREKLKMMKDGDRSIKTLTPLPDSDCSRQYFETLGNLDIVFSDLLKRQDKLFCALGERTLENVSDLVELMPPALEPEHQSIYKEYGPHVELKKLVVDMMRGKITEAIFYKEAASLVKMMHPGRIIGHFNRRMASKAGPRKLVKVTSTSSADEDRFGLSWSTERPTLEKAMPVASRLVNDAMERARSVHTYLTYGSGANLSMLVIGTPDPLTPAQKRINVGDLIIESHNDDHVKFSERQMVCPRPLEAGVVVRDLKPVYDRPPTPIADANRAKGKSRERIEAAEFSESKKKARELLKDVKSESDRRLKRKMKQSGLKFDKKDSRHKQATSLPDSCGRLKDRVYAKLEEWKILERNRTERLARMVESVSDLLPHVEGAQRDKFVRSLSRQVSSIVGAALKDARDIMFEAMNMPSDHSATKDEDNDSDDFGSVSSTIVTEPRRSTESVNLLEDGEIQVQTIQVTERTVPDDAERSEFMPVFGDKNLDLNQSVISSSLAAISVKHGTNEHDHDHAPAVSHMKQFFKNRASMPAFAGGTGSHPADRKRHSMPAALPDCMDPGNLQSRHSFFSVLRPDVKTLPEYRDKTVRQVEGVMQDHSLFGRLQELSPGGSDEELSSEDLGQADEEIMPKFRRQTLQAAVAPEEEEEQDSVSDLPPIEEHEHTPRAVVSMPTARRVPEVEDVSVLEAVPPPKTQSLTPSRMMVRCDSNPRLSLHTSTAEVCVDIHRHSELCQQHQSHHEDHETLQKIESSAFGVSAERTSSATKVRLVDATATGSVRRSGSADGGALLHSQVNSDDEIELRVHHPASGNDVTAVPTARRYY